MGLTCWYDETSGWFEYNILDNGTYNVLHGKWLAEGIAEYTPIVNDSTEYLSAAQPQYKLGLGCIDNFLWLYVNDKLFRKVDVSNYSPATGLSGLTVSSFTDPNLTVRVDALEFSKP
jgi:hypothetical protein